MKSRITILALAFCTFCVIPQISALAQTDARPVEPVGPYFKVEYQPSTQAGEATIGVTHTLWIPSGVKTVKGIIVHQHGCGVGSCKSGKTAAYDLHWQALAKKWDCALLGPSYHQAQEQECRLWCDPRNGSGDVFIQAMKDLAAKSNHPEIATAPWCLWGHSGGGFWSSLMQMKYPERIVAIWFQSGTAFGYWESGEVEKPNIPDAAMEIPMIANPGLKEKTHERFHKAWDGCLAMFKAYRAKGAPIAFTPDPKTGHDTGDSRYLAIPFFDAALESRLPKEPGNPLRKVDREQAWLCKLEGNQPIAAAANATSAAKLNALEANYLLNKRFATAWADFVKTGAVTDTTPPPPPKITQQKQTDTGIHLQWTASADLESGIQSFIIERDGKEIAQVPSKHPKKPYRNLFQGKTYGDTPTPSTASMKFTDPKGTKASRYRILSVNSVGLHSK